MKRTSAYQGSYLIGFLIIAVVALRTVLFYLGSANLVYGILLIAAYSLIYASEPWLSKHFRWYPWLYFPLQTALVIVVSNLRPFLDISSDLYAPLCIQTVRKFSGPIALAWLTIYISLLGVTQVIGLGWAEGLAFLMLFLSITFFLISYDSLYVRTQADQLESHRLLLELQSAHKQLQEFAAQADALAAARERNRLVRELHDSVSQTIFSITLNSQAARLLMEQNPVRVPEQIEYLRNMTSEVLGQFRSMIAQLRPK